MYLLPSSPTGSIFYKHRTEARRSALVCPTALARFHRSLRVRVAPCSSVTCGSGRPPPQSGHSECP